MDLSNILLEPRNYIETNIFIESKNREIVPFILNDIQIDYFKNCSWRGSPFQGERDVILKGRQHGFTSLKLAEYFHNTVTNTATNTVICAQKKEVAQKLLLKVKLMYRMLAPEVRPAVSYDNRNELWFPRLNSRITITVQGKGVGRGDTINNLLATEVGFWNKAGEVMHGLTEAVPFFGNIAIESTPCMMGDYFYKLVMDCRDGKSVYKLLEYPWYVNQDYKLQLSFPVIEKIKIRFNKQGNPIIDGVEKELIETYNLDIEQILWRRFKMLELGDLVIDDETGIHRSRKFSQEYECDFVQSGRPWIDSMFVREITKFQAGQQGKRYVHGVDTAEGLSTGDECAMTTLDFDTGEEVASLRGLWKPKEFALRIHNQCMKYPGLLGIEVNNTGLAVIERVTDLWEDAFGILYMDRPEDVAYWIYSDGKRLGWFTSSSSRVLMFVDGEEALKEKGIKLAKEDKILKSEIIACQYNDKNVPKAPEGFTDHSLISLLLAWQMKKNYRQVIDKQIRDVTMRIIGR